VAQCGPRWQLGLQPAAALRGGRGFAAPCPRCLTPPLCHLMCLGRAALWSCASLRSPRDPLYAPFHVSTLYMSHRGPSASGSGRSEPTQSPADHLLSNRPPKPTPCHVGCSRQTGAAEAQLDNGGRGVLAALCSALRSLDPENPAAPN
jgi:hypothetical protein